MTDFHTPEPRAGQTVNTPIPPHEPGPQPDPMLDESGRRIGGKIWAIGAAIFVVIVVTLYGLNNREPQTASNESASQTQSSSETTGAAPADQQAGKAQQGGPANSPNAAAPQKQQGSQTNQQPPKQQ
jgi:hypothetical protein